MWFFVFTYFNAPTRQVSFLDPLSEWISEWPWSLCFTIRTLTFAHFSIQKQFHRDLLITLSFLSVHTFYFWYIVAIWFLPFQLKISKIAVFFCTLYYTLFLFTYLLYHYLLYFLLSNVSNVRIGIIIRQTTLKETRDSC